MDLKFILTSIPFVHHPSQKIVALVKAYANDETEQARDEALLALGSLAGSSDAKTSDEITERLLDQLRKLNLKSALSFANATTLFFALGNTRNSAAIEPLSCVLVNATVFEKIRHAAAFVLSSQFDESRVDEVILERLRRQRNSESVFYGVAHLLANRAARNDGVRTELEKFVAAYLTNENHADYDNATTTSRTRRSTTTSTYWAHSNSQFNDISSLSSRRQDLSDYQNHAAYLYARRLGVDQLHVRLTAGGFAGANSMNPSIAKIFGKTVAYAHAFGRDYSLLESYLIVTGTESTLSFTVFARVGFQTIIPYTSRSFPACLSRETPVGKGANYRVLNAQHTIYLAFGINVHLYLSGNVQLAGTAGYELCPTQPSNLAKAYFKPSISFTANGGATAGIVVRRFSSLFLSLLVFFHRLLEVESM